MSIRVHQAVVLLLPMISGTFKYNRDRHRIPQFQYCMAAQVITMLDAVIL